MSRVAVVTGSNKGIGLAIVEGLLHQFDGTVYLTSRDDTRGKQAVAELNARGLQPRYHHLDVTSSDSLNTFARHLKEEHGGLDILVNNAAILDEGSDYASCLKVIDINYYSLQRVQEHLFPLLRAGARVLNVTSDCGHLSNVRHPDWQRRLADPKLTVQDIDEFVQWYLNSRRDGTFDPSYLADTGAASYRVSKVAVSALTFLQARELAARGVSVNCVHPGLVRTDMTGHAGFYTVQEAARTPLELVLRAPAHHTGQYVWHDGKPRDWYDVNADYYFKYNTLETGGDRNI